MYLIQQQFCVPEMELTFGFITGKNAENRRSKAQVKIARMSDVVSRD
jgi:hypothetical protein